MRTKGVPGQHVAVLLLGAVYAAAAGCASVQSVNGPGEFGFLAKGGTCHSLASDAGVAAAIGFDLGRLPRVSQEKPIEPWRMLAFGMHEPFEKRGWSRDEILTFAKEILAAHDYSDKASEILGADLYFETACDLLQKGQTVQRFSSVTSKLMACLHRDGRKQGLQCTASAIQ